MHFACRCCNAESSCPPLHQTWPNGSAKASPAPCHNAAGTACWCCSSLQAVPWPACCCYCTPLTTHLLPSSLPPLHSTGNMAITAAIATALTQNAVSLLQTLDQQRRCCGCSCPSLCFRPHCCMLPLLPAAAVRHCCRSKLRLKLPNASAANHLMRQYPRTPTPPEPKYTRTSPKPIIPPRLTPQPPPPQKPTLPHLLVLSSHDLEDVALELLTKHITLHLGGNAPAQ